MYRGIYRVIVVVGQEEEVVMLNGIGRRRWLQLQGGGQLESSGAGSRGNLDYSGATRFIGSFGKSSSSDHVQIPGGVPPIAMPTGFLAQLPPDLNEKIRKCMERVDPETYRQSCATDAINPKMRNVVFLEHLIYKAGQTDEEAIQGITKIDTNYDGCCSLEEIAKDRYELTARDMADAQRQNSKPVTPGTVDIGDFTMHVWRSLFDDDGSEAKSVIGAITELYDKNKDGVFDTYEAMRMIFDSDSDNDFLCAPSEDKAWREMILRRALHSQGHI